MKINWIIASNSLAGGTKSNRLIAEAMARRGHDVVLYYSAALPKAPPFWRIRRFRKWLLRLIADRRSRSGYHLSRSKIQTVPVNRRPIDSSDTRDADVVVATWWETAEWISMWPVSKGMKAYFIRHYEVWGGDPERVKATYRLPFSKLVIARWLQRLMKEQFSDAGAVLIPNGVDREQFFAPEREKNSTLTVGLLYGEVAWKGVDTAFEAIRRVQKWNPDVRVVCFGSVSPGSNVQLPDHFQFFLQPPQNAIADIYSQTDCWIVPSTSEGFGMPGIEAAACRCPVVSTRCGGPEDYVQDGVNGFLVPVGDAEAMAEAVIKVLSFPDDQWKKMSEASYHISLEFDWDKSAEILERALMNDLATEQNPAFSGPAA